MQVLAFPNVSYKDLFKLEPKLIKIDEETLKQIQKDATYVNYLDRQRKDIDTIKKDERVLIPMDLDYNSIQGLSTELKVKLSRARPKNMLQAWSMFLGRALDNFTFNSVESPWIEL